MKNLKRISNYCNRVEAWRDWERLAQFAKDHESEDLANVLRPADDAGWREIDKQIAKLRSELQARGIKTE